MHIGSYIGVSRAAPCLFRCPGVRRWPWCVLGAFGVIVVAVSCGLAARTMLLLGSTAAQT